MPVFVDATGLAGKVVPPFPRTPPVEHGLTIDEGLLTCRTEQIRGVRCQGGSCTLAGMDGWPGHANRSEDAELLDLPIRFSRGNAVDVCLPSADDDSVEIPALNLFPDEGRTHSDHSCQLASRERSGAGQQDGRHRFGMTWFA